MSVTQYDPERREWSKATEGIASSLAVSLVLWVLVAALIF